MKKIAVVGCGAVAASLYVPVLQELEAGGKLRVSVLVDSNLDRAVALRQSLGTEVQCLDDWRLLPSRCDVAIVCLPHALHTPCARDLCDSGIHVMVEKPMATTAEGCIQMIAASERGRVKLAVALLRRFSPSSRFVKKVIDSGWIGDPRRFEISEGSDYNWPTVSGFIFNKQQAGGGCLMDAGVHVLDLLLWLLGNWSEVDYRDDNFGNVEANCRLRVRLNSGAEGTVQLSRTHALPKRARIEGTEGWIEFSEARMGEVIFHSKRFGRSEVKLLAPDGNLPTVRGAAKEAVLDLLSAIEEDRAPCVSGIEALPSIGLIERCYNSARRLDMPWMRLKEIRAEALRMENPYRDKLVLVTGGTGFVGGRLAEVLSLGYGARVRVLVRDFSRAAHLSRLPVEMVKGDILDSQALRSAVESCDYVFHCAFGKYGDAQLQRIGNVEGTRILAEACLDAGVKRLVFLSTIAVHGWSLMTDVGAQTAYREEADPYVDGKIEAEQVLMRLHAEKGLDYAVLRPGIVFGPRAAAWVIKPAMQIRKGRWVIAGNGSGTCNAVYIDNLITCMLQAAVSSLESQRAFPVADESLSWRHYAESLCHAVAGHSSSLTFCTSNHWLHYNKRLEAFRRLNRDASLRGKLKRALLFSSHRSRIRKRLGIIGRLYDFLPGVVARFVDEIHPDDFSPSRRLTPFNRFSALVMEGNGRVDGESTRKALNVYKPIPFEEGMGLTAAWLEFSRLTV